MAEHHHETAGLVIEPLVQGAGGMIVHPAGFLAAVRELCDRYGILMIADEVATGFGRTGAMFACQHEGVTPDIMALSKGITAGYLPLAATLDHQRVYDAFLGQYRELKTFFHGHTFTGNPLACAVALASLDLFEKDDLLGDLKPKIAYLEERLAGLSGLAHVGDVRSCGMVGGIELVRDREHAGGVPLGGEGGGAGLPGGAETRPVPPAARQRHRRLPAAGHDPGRDEVPLRRRRSPPSGR